MSDTPQDVDDLEMQIRSQLKTLISDAKSMRSEAKELLEKAEPLNKIRDSVESIIAGERADLQDLCDQHREVVRDRVERIETVINTLNGKINLRDEAIAGLQRSWANLWATEIVSAQRWQAATAEKGRSLTKQLDRVREKIVEMEERWQDSSDEGRGRREQTR